MAGSRLPASYRASRIKLERQRRGSGRKRDPGSLCAECGETPLKYDSKWPICLDCANKQLGLVGKNMLSRRMNGATRDELHAQLDDKLDLIDWYLGVGRPVQRPERRPRPGRSVRRVGRGRAAR